MASRDVPTEARLLFIYCLSNPRINMCGIYELGDKYIMLETGLTPKEIEVAKQYLADAKRILFYNGWVRVVNAEKHNNYQNSPKNIAVYNRELEAIPAEVTGFFDSAINSGGDSSIHSSIYTTRHTNHKSKIINNKSKTINPGATEVPEDFKQEVYKHLTYLTDMPESEVVEFTEKYEANAAVIRRKAQELANYCMGHGKTYKNYKAMLNNACIKDFGMRKPVYKPAPLPDEKPQTPEQRAASQKKIDEIRAKLNPRLSMDRATPPSNGVQNKKI